jgi:hypothetical protein
LFPHSSPAPRHIQDPIPPTAMTAATPSSPTPTDIFLYARFSLSIGLGPGHAVDTELILHFLSSTFCRPSRNKELRRRGPDGHGSTCILRPAPSSTKERRHVWGAGTTTSLIASCERTAATLWKIFHLYHLSMILWLYSYSVSARAPVLSHEASSTPHTPSIAPQSLIVWFSTMPTKPAGFPYHLKRRYAPASYATCQDLDYMKYICVDVVQRTSLHLLLDMFTQEKKYLLSLRRLTSKSPYSLLAFCFAWVKLIGQ